MPNTKNGSWLTAGFFASMLISAGVDGAPKTILKAGCSEQFGAVVLDTTNALNLAKNRLMLLVNEYLSMSWVIEKNPRTRVRGHLNSEDIHRVPPKNLNREQLDYIRARERVPNLTDLEVADLYYYKAFAAADAQRDKVLSLVAKAQLERALPGSDKIPKTQIRLLANILREIDRTTWRTIKDHNPKLIDSALETQLPTLSVEQVRAVLTAEQLEALAKPYNASLSLTAEALDQQNRLTRWVAGKGYVPTRTATKKIRDLTQEQTRLESEREKLFQEQESKLLRAGFDETAAEAVLRVVRSEHAEGQAICCTGGGCGGCGLGLDLRNLSAERQTNSPPLNGRPLPAIPSQPPKGLFVYEPAP